MSGIYIHIPFCKQACYYCDFHFSTSTKLKDKMVAAMLLEIQMQADFFDAGTKLSTIYFGGGSPSILDKKSLNSLLEEVHKTFHIDDQAEITLEANPDDLSKKKLVELRDLGVNRLSIGIQSFRDEDLKLMNRAHNASMALSCINDARSSGFENLNIDLIYGIPGLDLNHWKENLNTFFSFDVSHLSAYSLTIEDRTVFGNWAKKGKLNIQEDESVIAQFEVLMEMASKYNYEHYEISNFCKVSQYSKHNTSYWMGEKYLGIGPSAHSFNGKKRQWNMRSNPLYIKAIERGETFYEEEELSAKDKYNEYVLTKLRTKWGINLKEIESNFGEKALKDLQLEANEHLKGNLLYAKENCLLLTEKGKLVADKITSDLFIL